MLITHPWALGALLIINITTHGRHVDNVFIIPRHQNNNLICKFLPHFLSTLSTPYNQYYKYVF